MNLTVNIGDYQMIMIKEMLTKVTTPVIDWFKENQYNIYGGIEILWVLTVGLHMINS